MLGEFKVRWTHDVGAGKVMYKILQNGVVVLVGTATGEEAESILLLIDELKSKMSQNKQLEA